MKLIYSWLSNVIAIFVAATLIPGVDYGRDFWVLALTGLVFGLVNLFVRPLVILFTLPAVILSLGIALFFINALMLYLTAWIVGPFDVGSFWSALGAAVIIMIVNMFLHTFLKEGHRR
jgi:putative membrane protein